jgi:hypothetical protein
MNHRILNQCATLSDVNADESRRMIHGDSRCVEMNRPEKVQECVQNASTQSSLLGEPQGAGGARLAVRTTVDEALRLAIMVAVDAGDYVRAGSLVEIAKARPPNPTVEAEAAVARERGPR